jgi:uncharacterized membrane protein
MRVVQRLWADDTGAVVSAELVLVGSILVLGMIVGLATLRDHVVQELADIAGAIGEVQQTYSFTSITGHASTTAGSAFTDERDFCDEGSNAGGNDCAATNGAQCVSVSQPARTEGPG